MSNKCWRKQIQTIRTTPDKRLALVGVGHPLRGDDAVGLYIIHRLQAELRHDEHILLLDAGSAPENFTGKIRQFAPDLVLFIDAADMGLDAGSIQIMDIEHIRDAVASTHTSSLRLVTKLITQDVSCEVCLLGIQPRQTDFATSLSPVIENSVNIVVDEFVTNFTNILSS